LIAPKEEQGEIIKVEPPSELVALAEATGGEVIVCKGLKKTISNIKTFVSKNLVPNVVVYFLNDTGKKRQSIMVKYKTYKSIFQTTSIFLII